jgi:hypothetical protein
MKTRIRHGTGVPDIGDLCNYQLGFSDDKKHLYIRTGPENSGEIIDIMGWLDVGTGEKVDTLQDFFGEIVWRMYFEGDFIYPSGSILDVSKQELTDKSDPPEGIFVTNLVDYGGNIEIDYNEGLKKRVLMPLGYSEWHGTELNTCFLRPVAIKETSTDIKYKLWIAGWIFDESSISQSSGHRFQIKYRVYVDYTDGTIRN